MALQTPQEAAIMHEAVDLIKSGDAAQKEQAVQMLYDLIEKNGEHVGAWWLMANACYGIMPQDSLIAVENLLALNPEHRGGKRLHQKLLAEGVTSPDD